MQKKPRKGRKTKQKNAPDSRRNKKRTESKDFWMVDRESPEHRKKQKKQTKKKTRVSERSRRTLKIENKMKRKPNLVCEACKDLNP